MLDVNMADRVRQGAPRFKDCSRGKWGEAM